MKDKKEFMHDWFRLTIGGEEYKLRYRTPIVIKFCIDEKERDFLEKSTPKEILEEYEISEEKNGNKKRS